MEATQKVLPDLVLVHGVYIGSDEPSIKSERTDCHLARGNFTASVARYMTLCQIRGRPVRTVFRRVDQQYPFQDCARVTLTGSNLPWTKAGFTNGWMGIIAKSGVALPENLRVKWRRHAGCGFNVSTMCFL
jgi:hypothetical protein